MSNAAQEIPVDDRPYRGVAKWIIPKLLSTMKGWSMDSIRKKRETHWIEGVHWLEAPDGTFRYNLRAIDDWEEGKL